MDGSPIHRFPAVQFPQCYLPHPQQHQNQQQQQQQQHHRSKLTFFPLVALIFYEVSGGPFGVEDTVRSAGPLLAILGFVLFPFLWSIPEALITAELSTAFPSNGGYVLWISAAFGPFWGFQEGFWKWLSGVMDNALYPILFLDYFKRSLPLVAATAAARYPTLAIITALLTLVNYRGLTIVGTAATFLAAFSLLPFFFMAVLALPRIRPRRWVVASFKTTRWRGYLNSLFWNLNFWDKASTVAGEIDRPSETFPRALFAAVFLVVVSYVIPLLAGTGVMDLHREDWEDGYFADVGQEIGGRWLKWWINFAAALSNMGLFEAEMSSDSFQLLGMAEIGLLPLVFARRSKHGTPVVGILCSATGVLLLSWMSFQEIVELLNFLYCFGMLLEFAAFVWLRVKRPDLHRPFKLRLGTFGVVVFCLPPSAFLVVVMYLASMRTIYVSGAAAAVGVVLYPAIMFAKSKNWVEFATAVPGGDHRRSTAGSSSPAAAAAAPVPDAAAAAAAADPVPAADAADAAAALAVVTAVVTSVVNSAENAAAPQDDDRRRHLVQQHL